jgi:hypothetical protein
MMREPCTTLISLVPPLYFSAGSFRPPSMPRSSSQLLCRARTARERDPEMPRHGKATSGFSVPRRMSVSIAKTPSCIWCVPQLLRYRRYTCFRSACRGEEGLGRRCAMNYQAKRRRSVLLHPKNRRRARDRPGVSTLSMRWNGARIAPRHEYAPKWSGSSAS